MSAGLLHALRTVSLRTDLAPTKTKSWAAVLPKLPKLPLTSVLTHNVSWGSATSRLLSRCFPMRSGHHHPYTPYAHTQTTHAHTRMPSMLVLGHPFPSLLAPGRVVSKLGCVHPQELPTMIFWSTGRKCLDFCLGGSYLMCKSGTGTIVVLPQCWAPAPLAVKVQSPNHWTTREFPVLGFFLNLII